MIRNIKVLGLAVVAILAMSAMVASAASAAYWFKSDAGVGVTTTLKGEQKERAGGLFDEFTTTAGVVKCKKATYTGSASGPTQTSVTVHPEYAECTAFGFGATVSTAGCNYVFKTTATNFAATTEVECSAGSEITVVAKLAGVTKCTVKIGPQDVGLVTLTNMTNGSGIKDVHADINLANTISYSETKGEGAGACVSTAGNVGGGSYVGTATLSGFNTEGKATNIFVE
jgi:hypothetical protein